MAAGFREDQGMNAPCDSRKEVPALSWTRHAIWSKALSVLNSAQAAHPAQQDNILTSLLKVCAASFKPSTVVR